VAKEAETMRVTQSSEWVEKVLEQHRQLRSQVETIEEFLAVPRPLAGEKGSHTWAVELSRRLLALHDDLFQHFRFEEEVEARQNSFEEHPEAAGKLEEIICEHPAMLRELRDIVSDVLSYSEGINPEDPQLRRRIARLITRFHQHEEMENHLIQRMEYRDVGAVD
jgi:iron-sulfur cluster repair protein YtfE (RIC family)